MQKHYLSQWSLGTHFFLSNQDDARQQYVDLISSLVAVEGPAVAPSPAGGTKAFQTLLVTTEDNITTIRLNRPEKKNAITVEVHFGNKSILISSF